MCILRIFYRLFTVILKIFIEKMLRFRDVECRIVSELKLLILCRVRWLKCKFKFRYKSLLILNQMERHT